MDTDAASPADADSSLIMKSDMHGVPLAKRLRPDYHIPAMKGDHVTLAVPAVNAQEV